MGYEYIEYLLIFTKKWKPKMVIVKQGGTTEKRTNRDGQMMSKFSNNQLVR